MGAIYLIRHGQASFGAADYDQLSETGFTQARVLGESLAARVPQADLVVCGGMRRHRQTAETALAAMGRDAAWEEDAGWAEYDHVAVLAAYRAPREAMQQLETDPAHARDPRRVFQQTFAAAVQRWASGQHDQDYPESWPAFCSRVAEALQRLRERLGRSQTALVYTSGGPISVVAQRLLSLPAEQAFQLNWTLANCGVTKLIYSDRGLYLSSLNEHACFEGTHASLITYR
ncbi:MAG TPA: histidine phosphatase family protein [Solimonas sp.]|nr:histidine phosphatase family protein [Solimonas sp.]